MSLFDEFTEDAPGERAVYGAAEPEGDVVVIGGEEHTVGEWAAYEAAARAAARRTRAKTGGGTAESVYAESAYAGRSYVGGSDVAESLVTARIAPAFGDRARKASGDPLARAVARLQVALEKHEKCVQGGSESVWKSAGLAPEKVFVVSALTADDLDEAAGETDPALLVELAENARILGSGYRRSRDRPAKSLESVTAAAAKVPPFPAREAETDDPEGLTGLEAESLPRASAVERLRGKVAEIVDEAAGNMESFHEES